MKINHINSYELLKNLQDPKQSNLNIKNFDMTYSSIINENFIILKNNKYYKLSTDTSQIKFSQIETEKIFPITSSISFNNYNNFYVKNNGETFTIIIDNILTYENYTLNHSIRLTGNIAKKYIIKVCCGDSHATFLTHAGIVFSLGDNSLGQLGLGDSENYNEISEAIMIKDLLNYRINDIVCGSNHCIAYGNIRDINKKEITNKDIYLFSWGDNKYGQLGVNDRLKNYSKTPIQIKINNEDVIKNCNIKMLVSGINFSGILLDNGKLFLWGDNQFKQISPQFENKNFFYPVEISYDFFDNKKAKINRIITSANSTLLVTDRNNLLINGKFNNNYYIFADLQNYTRDVKIIFTDNNCTFLYFNKDGNLIVAKNIKQEKYVVKYKKEDENDIKIKASESSKETFNMKILNNNNKINDKNNNNIKEKERYSSSISNDTSSTIPSNENSSRKNLNNNNNEIEINIPIVSSVSSKNVSMNQIKKQINNNNNDNVINVPKPKIEIKSVVVNNNNKNLKKNNVDNKNNNNNNSNKNNNNNIGNKSEKLTNKVNPIFNNNNNTNNNNNNSSNNNNSNNINNSLNKFLNKDNNNNNHNTNSNNNNNNKNNINNNSNNNINTTNIKTNLNTNNNIINNNKNTNNINTNNNTNNNINNNNIHNNTNNTNTNNPLKKEPNEELKYKKISNYKSQSQTSSQNPIKKNTFQSKSKISISNIQTEENSYSSTSEKLNRSVFYEFGSFLSTQIKEYSKKLKHQKDIEKEKYFSNLLNNFTLYQKDKYSLIINFYKGIPEKFRGKIWLKCLGNRFGITKDYYEIESEKGRKNYSKMQNNFILPFEDLGIFKKNSPLIEDFYEIILTFISCRPDVNYQKEISFLAGILLINLEKFPAFICLLTMILSNNLIIYYLENKDNNSELIFIRESFFKQIFYLNLPDLCSHFELNNVQPKDYFNLWNKTLFSQCFNIDLVMRIIDVYVIEGEIAIFKAAIAILKELENEILNIENKDEIIKILIDNKSNINEDKVIKNMNNVKFHKWIKDEIKNISENLVPI